MLLERSGSKWPIYPALLVSFSSYIIASAICSTLKCACVSRDTVVTHVAPSLRTLRRRYARCTVVTHIRHPVAILLDAQMRFYRRHIYAGPLLVIEKLHHGGDMAVTWR